MCLCWKSQLFDSVSSLWISSSFPLVSWRPFRHMKTIFWHAIGQTNRLSDQSNHPQSLQHTSGESLHRACSYMLEMFLLVRGGWIYRRWDLTHIPLQKCQRSQTMEGSTSSVQMVVIRVLMQLLWIKPHLSCLERAVVTSSLCSHWCCPSTEGMATWAHRKAMLVQQAHCRGERRGTDTLDRKSYCYCRPGSDLVSSEVNLWFNWTRCVQSLNVISIFIIDVQRFHYTL